MANQPSQKRVGIPPEQLNAAKNSFIRDQPVTDDLPPGSFFDDPNYLDTLPPNAKALVCAVQFMGYHPDRPAVCHIESELALTNYERSQAETYLSSAFALEALSLRYIPSAHPGRGKSNNHMGRLYQRKWEAGHDIADLDQALRHYKLALEYAVENDTVRCEWVCDVGAVLLERYRRTQQEIDKEEARAYLDIAIELAGDSPVRARHLSNKGWFRYITASGNDVEREGQLTKSIAAHEEAIAVCDAHPGLSLKPPLPYGMMHCYAAMSYAARSSITKRVDDGKKAVSLLEKALTYAEPGDKDWEYCVHQLSDVQKSNAQVMGDPDPDEKACDVWRNAIEITPSAILARIHLARSYQDRSDRFLDHAEAQRLLGIAEQLANEAVNSLPSGYSNPGFILSSCASVYCTLYETRREVGYINSAIEYAQKATNNQRDPEIWQYYRLLAQTFIIRYERLSRAEDLRDCTTAAMTAFSKCPPGNMQSRADCLWIIGKAILATYDTVPNAEVLQQAVQAFLLSSQLMPKNTSSRALVLNDLGNAHAQLFSHEARPDQLEKAINAYSESLSHLKVLYGDDGHADILMVNAALGYVMLQRFVHWNADADIESAVKYYKRSLLQIDEHNPRYAIRAMNLSNALRLRFDAKQDFGDLKEAQGMLTQAIEGPVPLSDELKTRLLLNGASLFQLSYQVTNQLVDLENAVDNCNKAIAVQGAASTTSRGAAIATKGEILKEIAEASGKLSDFEASESALNEARQTLGEGSPHYWGAISYHANLLSYALGALENYDWLARTETLSPGVRIDTASRAAELANNALHDPTKARDYILISLAFLQEAILMHSSRLEQLRFVRKYQRIPGAAVALSLSAGDSPETALHRLETGRAFIWDRIAGRPTQLEALEAEKPDLAARFQTLQQRLSRQVRASTTSETVDLTSVSPDDTKRMQRHYDADAYRQVLEEIRSLPRFTWFLKTPETPADIQAYAVDAPIVFINGNEYRSDAVIITKDDVHHCPLPSFSMDQITEYAVRFIMALNKFGRADDHAESIKEYTVVMKWLWQAAAKPVLTSINWDAYNHRQHKKPRVVWVSTGWISVLPIHAAGDFESPTAAPDTNEPRCVHDIAISSYTNSLKALLFTQKSAQHVSALSSENQEVLVAAMATTPGLGPEGNLDVEPEISAIRDTSSPQFSVNVIEQPTSLIIRSKITPETKVIHFACHARADTKDPSRSGILLQDTTKSPSFSVRTILNLDLKGIGLVYLSACESGVSKDLDLRDEGIHIAGAFHIAGVPHVISTLWKVSDIVSAKLAALFYANLKSATNGADDIDLFRAPYALDEAIGYMRRRGVHPMFWGPFIHSGP